MSDPYTLGSNETMIGLMAAPDRDSIWQLVTISTLPPVPCRIAIANAGFDWLSSPIGDAVREQVEQ